MVPATSHTHHFFYPMPDGSEYMTGVCACGAQKVGRNWEPEIGQMLAHSRASRNGGAATKQRHGKRVAS